MTAVKICGLRDAGSALAAADAGADMIGLVFAASRRRVTPAACHEIVSALQERRRGRGPAVLAGPAPGEVPERFWFHAWAEALEDAITRYRPLTVGVFADQPAEEINDIAAAAGLDLVQLSGGEPAEFASRLERPAIMVRHVGREADPEALLATVRPGPAAVLLDTASPTTRGGTGAPFDWQVAVTIAGSLPVMLAGGLTPENVAEAIARTDPWAVDVSSGVETAGHKDVEKIAAFIKAAKGRRHDRR